MKNFIDLKNKNKNTSIIKRKRVVSNSSRHRGRSIEVSHLERRNLLIPRSRMIRSLLVRKLCSNGRNNSGQITVRHRGGGVKRLQRLVNRELVGFCFLLGTVCRVDYSPCHTHFLSLVVYSFGVLLYTTAPSGIMVGQGMRALTRFSRSGVVDFSKLNGLMIPLYMCKVGLAIFNVSLSPGGRVAYSRSAGCFSKVVLRGHKKFFLIRLSSKIQKLIYSDCLVTLGTVSNIKHKFVIVGNAGYNRRYGCRPKVRGVAMNPVDHPHGGGNGKHTPGGPAVSPWGWLTKKSPTVRHKKPLNYTKYIKSILAQYFTEDPI